MLNIRWKKHGRIFHIGLKKKNSFSYSHTSNPVPVKIKNDIYRIFYASRNKDNKSSIFSFDFDLKKLKIIKFSNKPVIKFNPNSYFSHGVTPGQIFKYKNTNYMLCMCWQIPQNQHWRGDIGIFRFNKKMNKLQANKKIFLDAKKLNEISLSYPAIIKKKSILDIFYGSTVEWESDKRDMIHIIKFLRYNLKSKKIFCKKIAIHNKKNICEAMSRPTILDYKNILNLWFSYRNGKKNSKYKIGYAFFKNKKWKLDLNKNIIKKSKLGFDSEMVEYPYVFKHKKKLYMLYNGNSYGASGIGLAYAY